jgi:hypothetical protein
MGHRSPQTTQHSDNLVHHGQLLNGFLAVYMLTFFKFKFAAWRIIACANSNTSSLRTGNWSVCFPFGGIASMRHPDGIGLNAVHSICTR